MIVLLPPSETKQTGGSGVKTSVSFAEMASTRAAIQTELLKLCKDPAAAIKALKLGPKQHGEIAINLSLTKPKTRPAIDRYTGVLFDALKQDGLSSSELKRASKLIYIQSALFGLISAADQIPNYRLSAGSKIPGVNLKELWSKAHEPVWSKFKNELVIDLRSKAYAELAPIPEHIKSYEVEVLVEDSKGNRRALNHFNKQAKGLFVKAILSASSEPKTIADLRKAAKLAGLKLESSANQLLLITHG
jgi:cytoplasmic iron level regulating protein YaaA (DUF328/UPF0246 family)